MADVRALLAAERQARRISHPYLTYTKTGALLCNVCDLNVKSEQLWPGHLKSLNHRKNVQNIQKIDAKPVKRKREEVEDTAENTRDYEIDSRKKPKQSVEGERIQTDPVAETQRSGVEVSLPEEEETSTHSPKQSQKDQLEQATSSKQLSAVVDEDEWAAFERDVVPLAQANYSAATIEAAPISATDLAGQKTGGNRPRRENEAEEEKEDESRRMEEEFDVMEEMEERVKRLRERRDALRNAKLDQMEDTSENGQAVKSKRRKEEEQKDVVAVSGPSSSKKLQDEESSDDDEIDDWYG